MNSFVAILVCSIALSSAAASASKTHYGAPSWSAPAIIGRAVALPVAPVTLASTGTSSQFRQEDNHGNSNFGYDESHATGATSRREETINGVTRGSYSLSEADGRRRLVTYIADNDGFRATIQTNEPGVEPKDPADVLINKSVPVAVPVAAPAPLPVPVAAPVVLPAAPALPSWAPVKGRVAQVVERVVEAPLPPVAASEPVIVQEEPTPRAFSYSLGVSHLAASAPLALPAPVRLAAPIVQEEQQLVDY